MRAKSDERQIGFAKASDSAARDTRARLYAPLGSSFGSVRAYVHNAERTVTLQTRTIFILADQVCRTPGGTPGNTPGTGVLPRAECIFAYPL
jgi:hypothetical protein